MPQLKLSLRVQGIERPLFVRNLVTLGLAPEKDTPLSSLPSRLQLPEELIQELDLRLGDELIVTLERAQAA